MCRRREKNEKENFRMLLIPKNCINPEHFYLGSWKENSNSSSFLAQIWAPVFLISEHSPVTDPLFWCPPDLQKMGLTAVLGTMEDWGPSSLGMQDAGSAPCSHEGSHLPGTKPPRLTWLLCTNNFLSKSVWLWCRTSPTNHKQVKKFLQHVSLALVVKQK